MIKANFCVTLALKILIYVKVVAKSKNTTP